jgi:hypothetical protein
MLSVQVRVPSQGQELVPIAVMDKNIIRFPIRCISNQYGAFIPITDLIYTLGNDRLKEERKLGKKPTGKKSVIYSFALILGNLDYRQEQDGSVS